MRAQYKGDLMPIQHMIGAGPQALKGFLDNQDHPLKERAFVQKLYYKAMPDKRDFGYYIDHQSGLSMAAASGLSWPDLHAIWVQEGKNNEAWTTFDDLLEQGTDAKYSNMISPIEYLIANGDVTSLEQLRQIGINGASLKVRTNDGSTHREVLKASGVMIRPELEKKFDIDRHRLATQFLTRMGPMKLALISGDQAMIKHVVTHMDPLLSSLANEEHFEFLVAQLAMCDIDANWFWKEVMPHVRQGVVTDTKSPEYVLNAIYPLYRAQAEQPDRYLKSQLSLSDEEKSFLGEVKRAGWNSSVLRRMQGESYIANHQFNQHLARLLNMDPNCVRSDIAGLAEPAMIDVITKWWQGSPRCFYMQRGLDDLEINESDLERYQAQPLSWVYEEKGGLTHQVSEFRSQYDVLELFRDPAVRFDAKVNGLQAMALFGGESASFLPLPDEALFYIMQLRVDNQIPVDQDLKRRSANYIFQLVQSGMIENEFFEKLITHAFDTKSDLIERGQKIYVYSQFFQRLIKGHLTYPFFESLVIPPDGFAKAIRATKLSSGDESILRQYLFLHRVYQTAKRLGCVQHVFNSGCLQLTVTGDGGEAFSPMSYRANPVQTLTVLDMDGREIDELPLMRRALALLKGEPMTMTDMMNPYYQGLATRAQVESMSCEKFKELEAQVRGSIYGEKEPELLNIRFIDGQLDAQTLSAMQIEDKGRLQEDQRKWVKAEAMVRSYLAINGIDHQAKGAVTALTPNDGQRASLSLANQLRGGLGKKQDAVKHIYAYYGVNEARPSEEGLKHAKFRKTFGELRDFDSRQVLTFPSEFKRSFEENSLGAIQKVYSEFFKECRVKIPDALFSSIERVDDAIKIFEQKPAFATWCEQYGQNLAHKDQFNALKHLYPVLKDAGHQSTPGIQSMFHQVMKWASEGQCLELIQLISSDHPFAILYRQAAQDSEVKSQALAIALFERNYLIAHDHQVEMLKDHKSELSPQRLEISELHHTSWVKDVWSNDEVANVAREELMMFELLSGSGPATDNAFMALFQKDTNFMPSPKLWRILAEQHHGLFVNLMHRGENINQLFQDTNGPLLHLFFNSNPKSIYQTQLILDCLGTAQADQAVAHLSIHSLDDVSIRGIMDECLRKQLFKPFNALWKRGFRLFSKEAVESLAQAQPKPGEEKPYKAVLRSLLARYFAKVHGKSYLAFTVFTVCVGASIAISAATVVPALLFAGCSQAVFAFWMSHDPTMNQLMLPKTERAHIKSGDFRDGLPDSVHSHGNRDAGNAVPSLSARL